MFNCTSKCTAVTSFGFGRALGVKLSKATRSSYFCSCLKNRLLARANKRTSAELSLAHQFLPFATESRGNFKSTTWTTDQWHPKWVLFQLLGPAVANLYAYTTRLAQPSCDWIQFCTTNSRSSDGGYSQNSANPHFSSSVICFRYCFGHIWNLDFWTDFFCIYNGTLSYKFNSFRDRTHKSSSLYVKSIFLIEINGNVINSFYAP